MGLIIGIVFLGVFAVVALLMLAGGAKESPKSKQALAALASTLALESPKSRETIVDFRKDAKPGEVSWFNRWLSKNELAPLLKNLLSQANLNWTAGGLLSMCIGSFTVSAYLVYLRTGTPAFSFVAGIALGSVPLAFVLQKRNQRFKKFEEELPDALDLMVSALRVGQSLNAAMGVVARECPEPIGSEFRACFDEQNFGLELRAAMENMIVRIPVHDLRMISTAILIQKESGGNLAEVLDKTSYIIRERFRLKRQVRVHTAQGRMTGWILSILPVALGIILYLLSPETISVLWQRPLGIKLLYICGGLMTIGAFLIRKIVNMDV